MDLAEKRRQLEEIRAAREAKQRSVLQQQSASSSRLSSARLSTSVVNPPRFSPSLPPSALYNRSSSSADWTIVSGVGVASALPTAATTISSFDASHEIEEKKVPLLPVPVPMSADVAVFLAHSLRPGWGVRCVLDVLLFSQGEDCLIAAVTLSGVCDVDVELSDRLKEDSTGMTLLWAVPLLSTGPRGFVRLCCGCEVRCLAYTRHRPQLLFGGTASGRVVSWRVDEVLAKLRIDNSNGGVVFSTGNMGPSVDALSASAQWLSPLGEFGLTPLPSLFPCEQSFPSPHAHQAPVLGMAVHGDANYHHLYSVSEEGRVCMWAPLSIRLPSSCRDSPHLTRATAAAFVDKAADAMSKVLLGCADGSVLEGRAKSTRSVELRLMSTGACAAHHGAVLAIAPHPLQADPRVSDTLLTAASDGSCALWLAGRRVAVEGFVAEVQCLRWSPTHASVFAAGESNGRVAFWDLSRSVVAPVAFVYVRRQGQAAAAAAVTSIAFSDDGNWLLCGCAGGEVHLLRLREDLVFERRSAVHDGSEGTDGEQKGATTSWIDARFAF